MDLVHGPLRGPGPWTTPVDHPLIFVDECCQRSKQILGTLIDETVVSLSGLCHILHLFNFFLQFHTNVMGSFKSREGVESK